MLHKHVETINMEKQFGNCGYKGTRVAGLLRDESTTAQSKEEKIQKNLMMSQQKLQKWEPSDFDLYFMPSQRVLKTPHLNNTYSTSKRRWKVGGGRACNGFPVTNSCITSCSCRPPNTAPTGVCTNPIITTRNETTD